MKTLSNEEVDLLNRYTKSLNGRRFWSEIIFVGLRKYQYQCFICDKIFSGICDSSVYEELIIHGREHYHKLNHLKSFL